MKTVRIIAIVVFLVSTFNVVNGQARIQPKKINAKKDYTHSPTKMSFPTSLLGDYQRESVYSFDRKNQNIGVTYGKNQNGVRTMFSIYLYMIGIRFCFAQ